MDLDTTLLFLKSQTEQNNFEEINVLRICYSKYHKDIDYQCDICKSTKFAIFTDFMDHFFREHRILMFTKSNNWGLLSLYRYDFEQNEDKNRAHDYFKTRPPKASIYFSKEFELRYQCSMCESYNFFNLEEVLAHFYEIHPKSFDFEHEFVSIIVNIEDDKEYKRTALKQTSDLNKPQERTPTIFTEKGKLTSFDLFGTKQPNNNGEIPILRQQKEVEFGYKDRSFGVPREIVNKIPERIIFNDFLPEKPKRDSLTWVRKDSPKDDLSDFGGRTFKNYLKSAEDDDRGFTRKYLESKIPGRSSLIDIGERLPERRSEIKYGNGHEATRFHENISKRSFEERRLAHHESLQDEPRRRFASRSPHRVRFLDDRPENLRFEDEFRYRRREPSPKRSKIHEAGTSRDVAHFKSYMSKSSRPVQLFRKSDIRIGFTEKFIASQINRNPNDTEVFPEEENVLTVMNLRYQHIIMFEFHCILCPQVFTNVRLYFTHLKTEHGLMNHPKKDTCKFYIYAEDIRTVDEKPADKLEIRRDVFEFRKQSKEALKDIVGKNDVKLPKSIRCRGDWIELAVLYYDIKKKELLFRCDICYTQNLTSVKAFLKHMFDEHDLCLSYEILKLNGKLTKAGNLVLAVDKQSNYDANLEIRGTQGRQLQIRPSRRDGLYA